MVKSVVISAPSGSGKSSIKEMLLRRLPFLTFSISGTTRLPRKGETDGKEYYFLSCEDFNEKKRQNQFLEFEEVYSGQCYGTLKSELDRAKSLNKILLFDVDVKGAVSIIKKLKTSCLPIFVKAPSMKILEMRLKNRKTESKKSLSERMKRAEYELGFENKFEHVVVNDKLSDAVSEIIRLIQNFVG